MKICWLQVDPNAQGKYIATPGAYYAVLMSVDKRGSVSDIVSELTKQEFRVNYSWEYGQPTARGYLVDNWLAGLTPSAEGTRWIYFEGWYTGNAARSLAKHVEKCVLGICGAADVAYLFEAQQVPDNYHPCGPGDPNKGSCPALPPPCPGCPSTPFPLKPMLLGAAAGGVLALGLAWWKWG